MFKHTRKHGDSSSVAGSHKSSSWFRRRSNRHGEQDLEEDPTAIDREIAAMRAIRGNPAADTESTRSRTFGDEGAVLQPESHWFGGFSSGKPHAQTVVRAESVDSSLTEVGARVGPAAGPPPPSVNKLFGNGVAPQQSSGSQQGDVLDETCSHQYRHSDALRRFGSTGSHVARVERGAEEEALEEGEVIAFRLLIRDAQGLMAADKTGTSDPYAEAFIGTEKVKTKTIYKTTEPSWQEEFIMQGAGRGPSDKLEIHVYDKDYLSHDYLGSVVYDLSQLPLDTTKEVTLPLRDLGKAKKPLPMELGRLSFDITRFRSSDGKKKSNKKQVKSRLVTVDLIEANNLPSMDDNGLADPYVKLSIRDIKKKSKIRNKTLHPVWKQRFEFSLHDQVSRLLKVEVYDRDYGGADELIGGCEIDLSELGLGKTREIVKNLDNRPENGEIKLLVTVTDLFARKALTSLDLLSTNEAAKYCGTLTVVAHMARGLAAKDMGGTSDPFVTCELGNSRQRTKTIEKTLNPTWEETLQFYVRDIFDVLRITVYDEDKGGKSEFLGALAIPLLEVRNGIKDHWSLKSSSLTKRSKGEIILTLSLNYNKMQALPMLIKPVEERHMDEEPKFKLPVLKNNIRRVTAVARGVVDSLKFIDSLFKWEFGFLPSLAAMIFWAWATLYLQFYHIPFLIWCRFVFNYVMDPKAKALSQEMETYEEYGSDDEDEDDDTAGNRGKQEKQGFRERFRAISQVAQNIQNRLGVMASYGEKFKNLFNWSVPTISFAVAAALLASSFLFYFLDIRYLLFVFGLRRFVQKALQKYVERFKVDPRKVARGDPVSNLLQRVPDDLERVQRRKFKVAAVRGRGRTRSQGPDDSVLEPVEDVDGKDE